MVEEGKAGLVVEGAVLLNIPLQSRQSGATKTGSSNQRPRRNRGDVTAAVAIMKMISAIHRERSAR